LNRVGDSPVQVAIAKPDISFNSASDGHGATK